MACNSTKASHGSTILSFINKNMGGGAHMVGTCLPKGGKAQPFPPNALGFWFQCKKTRFLWIKSWVYSRYCHDMNSSQPLADIGPSALQSQLICNKIPKKIRILLDLRWLGLKKTNIWKTQLQKTTWCQPWLYPASGTSFGAYRVSGGVASRGLNSTPVKPTRDQRGNVDEKQMHPSRSLRV